MEGGCSLRDEEDGVFPTILYSNAQIGWMDLNWKELRKEPWLHF